MKMKRRLLIIALLVLLEYRVLASIKFIPHQIAEANVCSIPVVGRMIFTSQGYLLAFEIVSMLLLAAMVGAMMIAKEEGA